MVKFVLEKNGDVAAQEVRDKINAVLAQLPQGTDQPVVSKFDIGATAVVNIVVSGDRDMMDLTRFAKKKIKENIETVSGVGSVDMVGGREREIHIVVNPLKMASLNLSTKQLKDAITQQNIEIPGGKVEQTTQGLRAPHPGSHQGREGFQLHSHRQRQRHPHPHLRHSEGGGHRRVRMTTASYLNGKPAVTLVVKKQSGTNTVEVVKNIRARLQPCSPSSRPTSRPRSSATSPSSSRLGGHGERAPYAGRAAGRPDGAGVHGGLPFHHHLGHGHPGLADRHVLSSWTTPASR
jgi:HAE1 family hydrophobic/amphiphilic exporter-1